MINSHLSRALAEARMTDIHRDVRINRQLLDVSDDNRQGGDSSEIKPLPRRARRSAR